MSAIIESSALIESFKTRAEAVSAQVERVATKELAMELVVRLLHQEAWTTSLTATPYGRQVR